MRRFVLCVAVTLLAACRPAGAAPVADGSAVVDRVVDGDTVVVLVGSAEETIRLIGIDTPETVKPDAPVECYGNEASALTAELLPVGTAVRLERDVEPRDGYGRLLAYVYRASDGLFVNLHLVEVGAATPLTFEPNTAYSDRFVDAARRAEEADLGLWGRCSSP